jgi:hypothetical protein
MDKRGKVKDIIIKDSKANNVMPQEKLWKNAYRSTRHSSIHILQVSTSASAHVYLQPHAPLPWLRAVQQLSLTLLATYLLD